MKHRVAGRQFGRNSGHRKALLRNLVTSLFENGRIETTVPKAKEVRRIAEPIVTKGVKGDLHAIRQVQAYVYTKSAIGKLFNDIGPRMKGRPGGYLRILKTRTRPGDSAPMAIVEFVDTAEIKAKAEAQAEEKTKKTARKKKEAAPAATEEKPKKAAAKPKAKKEASAEKKPAAKKVTKKKDESSKEKK